MYTTFLTILSAFILLINSIAAQTAAVGGQFSGGSLGSTFDRRSDGKRTVRLFLITGWVLGKGPCGPGCNKSDIGRSTRPPRSLFPSYLGNFTLRYQQGGTWIQTSINNEVDKTYNQTVIGVSDYDKWEQELLHFNVDMPDAYHSFIIDFDGFSWRTLTLHNNGPGPRWDFQVSITDELRNDTGKPNHSPIAIAKPVYRIKLGDVTELRIPSVDTDGDFIKCSMSEFVEAGDISNIYLAPNVHIFENCSMLVNASESDGYINNTWLLVQVSVRDYPRSDVLVGSDHYQTGMYSFSGITVQFSVHVVSQLEGPKFVHPTPEGNHLFYIYSGATWKADIYCQAVPNTTIAGLTTFGLHNENFTLTELKHDSTRQVKFSTMSWLPSVTDTGSHIACVNAIDDTGVESSEQRCFILDLKANVFNHTTQVFTDKPYFTDVPAPGQYIPCLTGTTCIVPLYVKSDISLRDVHITQDFTDESKLWPFEKVTLRGVTMFKADFSFKHNIPGIVLTCFTAADNNMQSSEEVCVHIEIETPDPCLSGPCQNSATCLRDKSQNSGFACLCLPGTYGTLCENRDDPCLHNPCNAQGASGCYDLRSTFYCLCHTGFTGITCDTNIYDCRNDSCNGHGLCIDEVNSFSCLCFDRYNGSRCENDKCPAQKNNEPTCSRDLDPCTQNPCVRGTCYSHASDFLCTCPFGYTGQLCETDLDPCTQNPCVAGTCYSHTSDFLCTCPFGYTGQLRETEYVQVRVGNAFSMNCTDPGIKSTSFNWSKANACDIKYDAVKGSVFNVLAAFMGDSGLYSCTASDGRGTNVTKHFLVDVTSDKREQMCDFDNGYLCGWQQEKNDNFDWTLQNGPTSSYRTGPNNDHTLGTSKGKYLYVESYGRNIGEYATLTSPIQVANLTICFEFWYYMFGDGIGGLFVLLQDSCTRNERQIFKEAGNQGERWYKASLTISSQLIPKDYRIMIKADVADPGFGDTSIDDLVIRKTQCPDSHGVPIIG